MPYQGTEAPMPRRDPSPPEARTEFSSDASDGEPSPRDTVRRIASRDLLRGADEVIVEHEGDQYRLRHTSKGRLILTK